VVRGLAGQELLQGSSVAGAASAASSRTLSAASTSPPTLRSVARWRPPSTHHVRPPLPLLSSTGIRGKAGHGIWTWARSDGDGVAAGTQGAGTGSSGVCGRRVWGWVACAAAALRDWSAGSREGIGSYHICPNMLIPYMP
jgi:hypothetical protein